MKAFFRLLAYSPLVLLILIAAVLDSVWRWQYPIYGQRRISL